jgi:putative sterol carrier protein
LIAALAVLGYCALIIGLAYRWDKPSYFDWAVAGYFGGVSVSIGLWSETASRILVSYSTTGIYAVLFAAAFIPPLVGLNPFTYHYAKKSTPRDHWDNPIFVRINLIMTYVWAGIFAVCIGVSLYPSVVTRAVIPIGLIVGFGIPFNRWFPDSYLKRLGLPSLAEQQRMTMGDTLEGEVVSSLPLPSTAWQAISGMPEVFNAKMAGDLKAVIGFNISGSETFEAYLQVEDGICTLKAKSPRVPDLLIRSPADVWLAISRRERDGQEAFMRQAFTAEGNLGILMRMNQIFGGAAAAKAETAGRRAGDAANGTEGDRGHNPPNS